MKCFNFELSLKFIWCHARRLLWTANSSYHGRVWPAKLSHAICYLNLLWHHVLWVSGLDNFITIQTIRWSLPFVILNKCRALRHPSFSSFQMFRVFYLPNQVTSFCDIWRSSHLEVFLKILQNSQGKTYAGSSSLIKLQTKVLQL